MKIIIILANQLYENPPILDDCEKKDKIILYEHPSFFIDYKFHKMKLVMHRATMKCYNDYLDRDTIYLEYDDDIEEEIKKIIKKNKEIEEIKIYNPIDHDIMREFKKISKKTKLELKIIDNPGFICNTEDYEEYIKDNSYMHHIFYIWCRKKFDILIKKDKPFGNKW